ncbi:MAG: NAD-dependent dehydratase [Candidatus Lambdaproteobacteria bacterium]|nr:NAD-dependent dehydratase [Candidatus Lambdaproteobacteria bacterium]
MAHPHGVAAALVTGATTGIGGYLLPALAARAGGATALGRGTRPGWLPPGVAWLRADLSRPAPLPAEGGPWPVAFHLAPLGLLVPLIEPLARAGCTRVVAVGTTSRFTKADSADGGERALAQRFAAAEAALASRCAERRIAWTLLRPTLIWGGRGRNAILWIARVVERAGWFPLVGPANGLRQPVHAEDLAQACLRCLDAPGACDRAYNLSGAEALPFRELVARVFQALEKPPRFAPVPAPLCRGMIRLAAGAGLVRGITPAALDRLERDLCFDHGEATRDFGYAPRGFRPTRADLLPPPR